MKVVSPYRPFPAESKAHHALGAFDWIEALRLMRASVQHSCRCEAYALTDVDTDLPVPMIQVETAERRLMLWIVEASLRYLESEAFDDDTVLLSPDVLAFQDLRSYFYGDFSVVVRMDPKYQTWPLLNVAQWWPLRGRTALIALYQEVLERARTLPEDVIVWGADTEPLVHLLKPLTVGTVRRTVRGQTLDVRMLSAKAVLRTLSSGSMAQMDAGLRVKWPSVPLIDCRGRRKHYLARYFAETIGQLVHA